MKNKLERFLEYVCTKTKNGEISWSVDGGGEYIKFSFDPQYVDREFVCNFDEDTILALVQIAIPRVNHDTGDYFHIPMFEMHVIKDDTLVFTLNQQYTPREKLLGLFELVEQNTNEAKDFFKEWETPEKSVVQPS